MLNISSNQLTTIDFAFIGQTVSLNLLDISNNYLNGRFYFDAVAKDLYSLNIANNNFTSVQQNLKTHAPSLEIIYLSGNHFDCDDLTDTILLLSFDRIKTITPIEDELETIAQENVKGIRCNKRRVDIEFIDRSL